MKTAVVGCVPDFFEAFCSNVPDINTHNGISNRQLTD